MFNIKVLGWDSTHLIILLYASDWIQKVILKFLMHSKTKNLEQGCREEEEEKIQYSKNSQVLQNQ